MASDNPPKARRRPIWAYALGTVVVAGVAIVALWNWDWFIPILDRRASSALGRKTTVQHLHVALGRTTIVTMDGVEIASAEGYPTDKPFATAEKLSVAIDVMAYLHGRHIVLPQITVDKPVIDAEQNAKGEANWPAPSTSSSSSNAPADPDSGTKIGELTINDGHAHVVLAKLKADFNLDIATRQGNAATTAETSAKTPPVATEKTAAEASEIVVTAKGTYAAQPITGELIGGALLSLRDAAQPYPINLHLANGPTRVALTGTVQDPLNFAGANLKLEFAGPDMALLTPLTGVPIPETPPYSIAGKLDYADKKIRFTGFTGRLGSSDLNGDISVDPTRERPFVDATLSSRRVDLADLGGFIGATPGRKGGATQSGRQNTEQAKSATSDRILPDTPISLPKLSMADVRLKYKGAHIEGRSVPLDNIVADLSITDGRVKLDPLSFGVGTGQIQLATDLAPVGKDVKADATISFKRVDLARLLSATHLVEGAGQMSGSARLVSTGNSLASLLGHGDGGLKLGMSGGNLSALLVDIAGLEFGNAILSALGIPQRAQLECFAADFGLNRGVMGTKTFILDTSEAQVVGTGDVNLANETIDYKLKTATKHFSVGSLPTPIDITGRLKSPSIRPEIGPLAVRAGAAVGLGILFPPAALIPTIQFGTGDDGKCSAAEAPIARSTPASITTTHSPARGGSAKRPPVRRTAPHR